MLQERIKWPTFRRNVRAEEIVLWMSERQDASDRCEES